MKKGFTIIEIVTSIAIVLLVTLIVIRSVTDVSDKNKKELYNTKINNALITAKDYGNDIIDELSSNCKAVTIGELITNGYLTDEENGHIYDPRTNESMNNIWICITYTDNKIKTYLKEGE